MVTENMLSTREVKSLPRRMISLSGSMCPTKHSLSGLPSMGKVRVETLPQSSAASMVTVCCSPSAAEINARFSMTV